MQGHHKALAVKIPTRDHTMLALTGHELVSVLTPWLWLRRVDLDVVLLK
jgi:hypothetical protein